MKLKIKDFALKGDLICVKEFAKYSFCSPKFLSGTFLNADIKRNKLAPSKDDEK